MLNLLFDDFPLTCNGSRKNLKIMTQTRFTGKLLTQLAAGDNLHCSV
jgi:hypothetical protein